MPHKIYYIDVFTQTLGFGNPVAVIMGADNLDDKQMQRIASWTNLSETTFIRTPKDSKADYELRIFTPKTELPFAGHPTIGSCYAVIAAGIVPKKNVIIQECGVGLVEIRVGECIEFTLPPSNVAPFTKSQTNELAQILGQKIIGDAALVDVGPKWIIAQLETDSKVLDCKPDFTTMKQFEKVVGGTGVTIFGKITKSTKESSFIEVRSFTPSHNIEEDPVCGSGNGAVCAFMLENNIVNRDTNYIASQGAAIGRGGKIYGRIDKDGKIFIGGNCVIGIIGETEF